MNVQLLIDAIVRQTTVLIAQLATTGGSRAPLANVANQVFLDLADLLHEQGVSRKVSADMFGLALRTYLRKIQRLRESSTENGRSLWEAVLEFLNQGRLVTRAEVLTHFHRDDPELVRGVVHDLTESGLVMRLGSGPGVAYRAATADELAILTSNESGDGTDEFVWALIYREGPITHAALEKAARACDLEGTLGRLLASKRVQVSPERGVPVYRASELFVTNGSATGWEAAVFDHFHAMVRTIATRLRTLAEQPGAAHVGGSTYTFDIWTGHPMEDEVLGQLESFRRAASDLRARVRAYNDERGRNPQYRQVTFYGGQTFTDVDEETE